MVGDGEAVGLVPDLLQQVQGLRGPGDAQRVGPAGEVHLLELLGQGGHRDLLFQPQLFEDPQGHVELTLAAVDEQQLRRIGEPAPPVLDRLVPLRQVGAAGGG